MAIPLGSLAKRPHATNLSRAAALYSIDKFRAALADWLSDVLKGWSDLAAAVDGKTNK